MPFSGQFTVFQWKKQRKADNVSGKFKREKRKQQMPPIFLYLFFEEDMWGVGEKEGGMWLRCELGERSEMTDTYVYIVVVVVFVCKCASVAVTMLMRGGRNTG